MRKKSFTLVEIIITIVVIGILVTIGLPVYQTIKEDAAAKVCATNQKAIATAYKICVMERGVVPACLSKLPSEYIKQAYAQLLQQKGAWKIKLAYFICDWRRRGLSLAYAQPPQPPFLNQIARGDIKLITCPKDPTPPPEGISYGYNILLNNTALKNIPADTILFADSDTATFTGDTLGQLAERHKEIKIFGAGRHYAIGVDKEDKEWGVHGGQTFSMRRGH